MLDRRGDKELAITKYERAIEILSKLCNLYPNSNHSRVYTDYIKQYKGRVGRLKGFELEERSATKTESSEFQMVTKENSPDVKWDDIADLVVARRVVNESIVYPCKRPDLFPLGWPRGILLYGPPGCGKTLLAAAVATEIDADFYNVDAAQIMSKWLGDSERNVASLFNSARSDSDRGHPAIIFIDEIDSLIGIRQEEVGGEVRTRNQFMKEMDNVIDKNKKLQVYVIGATNKPWNLDEPFLRRFPKRILIPLPDIDARKQLFEIYLRGLVLDSGVSVSDLAKKTEGYSGSDIRDICQASHNKVVSELFEAGKANDRTLKPRNISVDDFYEVIGQRRPSVKKENLKYYDLWNEKLGAS